MCNMMLGCNPSFLRQKHCKQPTCHSLYKQWRGLFLNLWVFLYNWNLAFPIPAPRHLFSHPAVSYFGHNYDHNLLKSVASLLRNGTGKEGEAALFCCSLLNIYKMFVLNEKHSSHRRGWGVTKANASEASAQLHGAEMLPPSGRTGSRLHPRSRRGAQLPPRVILAKKKKKLSLSV